MTKLVPVDQVKVHLACIAGGTVRTANIKFWRESRRERRKPRRDNERRDLPPIPLAARSCARPGSCAAPSNQVKVDSYLITTFCLNFPFMIFIFNRTTCICFYSQT